MKNITVEYDPLMGVTVPDGQVAQFVDDVIAFSNASSEFTVGSEMIMNQFRIVHAQKRANITLKFKGDILDLHEDGSLGYWPHDYCRIVDNQLMTLLDIRFKKAK